MRDICAETWKVFVCDWSGIDWWLLLISIDWFLVDEWMWFQPSMECGLILNSFYLLVKVHSYLSSPSLCSLSQSLALARPPSLSLSVCWLSRRASGGGRASSSQTWRERLRLCWSLTFTAACRWFIQTQTPPPCDATPVPSFFFLNVVTSSALFMSCLHILCIF